MIALADAHVRRQQRNERRCSCLLRTEIEINLSMSDWHNRCAPINIIKLVIEIISLSLSAPPLPRRAPSHSAPVAKRDEALHLFNKTCVFKI